jgi:AraC-like DNA-binding protein
MPIPDQKLRNSAMEGYRLRVLNSSLQRSGANARDLLALGIQDGIDPIDLLHGTGLTRTQLDDLSREITAAHEQRLIENLVRLADDQSIGLRAGSRSTLATLGMLGFACASAPTLRKTVEISLRYQDLAFTLANSELVREQDATFIVIDTSHLPDLIGGFVVDHLIATIHASFREMAADIAPPRIELTRPAPCAEVSAVYEERCGTLPRFSAETDRLGFSDTDLDRPRTAIDTTALRLCEAQCMYLLAERQAHIGVTGLVRERLTHATGTMPSMTIIAADLHTSARHLRRTLALEGTSFRTLNEQVRLARAKELLDHGTPVQDVAETLGYASSSAFVHAFKRWTPTTPGRHKASARTTRARSRLIDPAPTVAP